MSPPPDEEFDSLLRAIMDAVNLAEAGDPAAGSALLLESLARAQERCGDEEWFDTLAVRYRHALDLYAARYGIGRA